MIFLAHGIGGVRDLPVPESFFFTTAAIVLIVSFVLLGALWKRPLLEAHAGRARAAGRAQRVLPVHGAPRRAASGRRGALPGDVRDRALRDDDGAPQLGADLRLCHLLARRPAALGPLRERLACAQSLAGDRGLRGLAPRARRGGGSSRPRMERALGPVPRGRRSALVRRARARGPEARVSPHACDRDRALHYWALAGMAVYGRDAWTRGGEGFAVMFELLSRIAPFAVREGRVVVRWPFTGLGGAEHVPGTLVFVAVMLGSTSFDGFSVRRGGRTSSATSAPTSPSRRSEWSTSRRRGRTSSASFLRRPRRVTYLAAVRAAAALSGTRRSLVPDFVLPLVPIAAAYLVAHYFSLFLIQGQFIITLASDPFGRGWDSSEPPGSRRTSRSWLLTRSGTCK